MKKLAILLMTLTIAASAYAQSEYFGQNKIQYKIYQWQYIQTHNFDIYYDKGQDSLAYFAADVLEKANVIISEQLNHELTSRVPVIIYTSPNDFLQTNVVPDLLPEGVGGFTEVFKTRVVVPFDGSYENFRHVLHHELTHAITFNLLYENAISSLISRQALFNQPLWLGEGFAEYSSRKGWTYEADMFVRDAIVEDYLPPISQMFGLLNYMAGHALIIYLAETYGEQKIAEINNKGKLLITIERAIDASLGTDLEKISKDWHRELRRIYWPELAKRQTTAEIGKMLTDHQKDGSSINKNPVWSPRKDRIAITSDRSSPQDGYSDRFTDIFVVSSIDGAAIDKLVSAEKSGDLESLHSYYSGMSWSPDGDKLVFVSQSHGLDALFFVDAETKKIYKRFQPGLNGLRSPDWSPQGDKVIVTGINNGRSDLYILDLKTDKFTQLTSDKFEDVDPDFSPDGSRIAFTSDRPVNNSDDTTFVYGHYNIFIYNLLNDEIVALTDDETQSTEPDYSPDGNMLAYASYKNGISNIYIHDFSTGGDYPITNTLTGAFSPSWSPDGDKIAVSIFNYYGFDVAVIKDIKPIGDGELEPSSFKLTGRLYPDKEPIAEAEQEKESKIETTKDYSKFIFTAGSELTKSKTDSLSRDSSEVAEYTGFDVSDTLEYLLPDGSYRKKKYTPKFSPELVAGGFSYDNFYGLQGQSYISISDMMGNHHILVMSDVFNTIDNTNIQIYYEYLAKRLDYIFGVFHFKNTYWDEYNYNYFSDRVFGAGGAISYPFSRFSRIDLGLNQITIDRTILYSGQPSKATNLFIGSLSYISDGVVWGIVGPVYGQRYKLTLEQSLKLVNSGLSYTALEADYRKYFHFGKEYNFAFRLAGGASFGSDARRYNLGGTSYWISPGHATLDIYGQKEIYVNKLVVPLRGYDYFEFSGKNYALMNMELRFPFIDYFKMRWPLGMTLTQVRGSLFWDNGAAFDKTKDFKFFDEEKGFPKLGTIKSGIGFSAQANLGIFVLRYDLAWWTDLSNIAAHPRYYFSFGANY